jgi:hypothetical protein
LPFSSSEARSRHPRLGPVKEQYASAFAGERVGDGRADYACAHHCHSVVAYHPKIVLLRPVNRLRAKTDHRVTATTAEACATTAIKKRCISSKIVLLRDVRLKTGGTNRI